MLDSVILLCAAIRAEKNLALSSNFMNGRCLPCARYSVGVNGNSGCNLFKRSDCDTVWHSDWMLLLSVETRNQVKSLYSSSPTQSHTHMQASKHTSTQSRPDLTPQWKCGFCWSELLGFECMSCPRLNFSLKHSDRGPDFRSAGPVVGDLFPVTYRWQSLLSSSSRPNYTNVAEVKQCIVYTFLWW